MPVSSMGLAHDSLHANVGDFEKVHKLNKRYVNIYINIYVKNT